MPKDDGKVCSVLSHSIKRFLLYLSCSLKLHITVKLTVEIDRSIHGYKASMLIRGAGEYIQYIYSSPQNEGDQAEVSQKVVRKESREQQAQNALEWHTQTSKSIVRMNDVGYTSLAPNLCEVTHQAPERQQQEDTKINKSQIGT